MKSDITNYAKLLIEELHEMEAHSAVVKLKKLLKARRHESLLGPVMKKALRILEESTDSSAPILKVASMKDAKKYLGEMSKKSEPKVIVDDRLIGGYVLMDNYVMKDGSYRTKLIDWYRRAVQ
jgi:F0F1-type ATP synthase delta subunit